jgi:hypothetical protein
MVGVRHSKKRLYSRLFYLEQGYKWSNEQCMCVGGGPKIAGPQIPASTGWKEGILVRLEAAEGCVQTGISEGSLLQADGVRDLGDIWR